MFMVVSKHKSVADADILGSTVVYINGKDLSCCSVGFMMPSCDISLFQKCYIAAGWYQGDKINVSFLIQATIRC